MNVNCEGSENLKEFLSQMRDKASSYLAEPMGKSKDFGMLRVGVWNKVVNEME
jgi:hypothetical protein